MGRGQIALFDNMFKQQEIKPAEKKARQTYQRNELLAHRYYYYAEVKNYRYIKCLEEIAKENFLSTETVIDMLNDVRNIITLIIEKHYSTKELKQKYPWLDWSI